jgi:hypothetical protein
MREIEIWPGYDPASHSDNWIPRRTAGRLDRYPSATHTRASFARVAIATLVMGLVLSAAPALSGQAAAGATISGLVRGPGGVPVPGVTVKLIERHTREHRETWTETNGIYTVTELPAGTYELEVSLIGFRSEVRGPVTVSAGKELKIDITLVLAVSEKGAVADTDSDYASVHGPQGLRSPQIEIRRGSGSLEAAAGSATGAEDPSPNVSPSENLGEASSGDPTDSGDAASSDSSAEASAANSFLLSGSVARAAKADGDRSSQLQEVIDVHPPASAPGFGGGKSPNDAAVFSSMRSALRRVHANRIRGSVFNRYSNSIFDARPYPLNTAQSPRLPAYQEHAGISLGGPLIIPKVYQGRDKTSFYLQYSLRRNQTPFDSFATVPTLAERGGDFSQTVLQSGLLAGTTPTIYDPRSNPSGPRIPFPDNRIPQSALDPAAVGLLKFVPLPNLPGSVQNYHLQQPLPFTYHHVSGRIGHQISERDGLFAYYVFKSAGSTEVTDLPDLTFTTAVRSQDLNLSETHTFSPRIVNTVLLNFNRQRISTLNPFAFQEDIAGRLGIQGISSDPFDWGLPIISFTNFTPLNDTIPSLHRDQTFRLLDSLLMTLGSHELRFGGELRRIQLNRLTDPDARGTFTFSGFTSSDFTVDGFPVPETGFDFADFLLGLPQATSVRFGNSSNYFRARVYSAFVQDDWRLTPRLSINLGLRYEYFQPPTEKYGYLSNLAIGRDFASTRVVTARAGAYPESLIRGDGNNLSPHLGLALRPWSDRRVVLRAGYGIFYDGSIFQRLVLNLANQPPFAQAATLLTTPQQVLTLEQGFPEIAPSVARNTYSVDTNFRTPYGQTWSLTIEDEIARNLNLLVGYVGIKGTKLDLLLAPNRAAPGSPLTTQERLAIENALQFNYETSGAASIYHGFQVGLRGRFHNGLSAKAEYIFSKSIDNAAGVGGVGRVVAQNNADLDAERGLSIFDVRHRFTMGNSYDLPFGEGRRFFSGKGTLDRVLADWQISGNATLQTGIPFTARVLGNAGNNSGTGGYFSERADATGQPVSLPGFQRSTLRYFNTASFTLPAPGEFGNAGRNTIPGPGTIDFDLSLRRSVTISREKGVRASLRLEATNIFNTPTYIGLATTVNASDFGRITSVGEMRSLRLSVRVRF